MRQKTLIVLLICFIFLIPKHILAQHVIEDYTIQSYNINMIVNENNIFDITENITVYFNTPRHGISRKIPIKNSVVRSDGSKSKNVAKITNIEVSENNSVFENNGYKVIKIGNPNYTLNGKHEYTIKYKYNIGRDKLKNADELYFNLIGNEWDTSIKNVAFNITMPKTFDKSLLGFSSGSYGSTNSSNVFYRVNGNFIKGNTINTLLSGEGLTIRLTLPEDYFSVPIGNDEYSYIFFIILCIIFVFVGIILWIKNGKDEPIIETVEFYPPKGYNSAEVAFLYKGEVDEKGIMSLIVYLANEGYLKIEESDDKAFKIKKLKEYSGNNEYERIFFDGLFENDLDNKNYVTNLDLYNKFYKKIDKIKLEINSKENMYKIFEPLSIKKKKQMNFMAIFVYILIFIIPFFTKTADSSSLTSLQVVQIVMLIFGIGKVCIKDDKTTQVISSVFILIFALVYLRIIYELFYEDPMYCIANIVATGSVLIFMILSKLIKKRNSYGKEMLGKISGFKRFLETAEKPQLEALVNENPEYFYKILPYTYSLGVSDKWIKQFETIVMKAPDWYEGNSEFNLNRLNNTIHITERAMKSSPSGSGSSGSSGGGSSGGGSGGGGGSSW